MTLATLLCDSSAADRIACLGRDREHSRAELAAHAGAVAARVRAAGSGRWLLHCDDAWAFAAGLLGLAHGGALAVLLPNRQPGTLLAAARGAQGACFDAAPESLEGVPCDVLDPLGLEPGDAAPLAPLEPGAPLLTLSTSGTTGEGKPVTKTLGHLDREVSVLEETFGPALGPGTHVFATASHQHLYGLLFRVLWPLAAGRPFVGPTFLHAEELLPRMEESGDAILVSTPAHLRRVPGLERVRGVCREAFSSGAPLEEETAARVHRALGHAPVEVFGSTETGGVAWRRQAPGEGPGPWTPLPGVRVSSGTAAHEAGRLVVESPFASVGSEAAGGRTRFTMGDLAEVGPDGRFALRGRADRVVKIGEKRLALPEMESELRRHAWVADAALVALERGGETRVGAALVISDAGSEALDRSGRRAFTGALGEHLGKRWDRVLLPRSWRLVAELPCDAQGKVTSGLLGSLFASPREPRVLAEKRDDRELVRDCEVPRDLAQLEGHFEGLPVVPGVVQLGWAVAVLGDGLGFAPRIRSVEALKFRQVLRPGQRFELRVEWSADAARARFQLSDGAERVFASGRLALRAGGATR